MKHARNASPLSSVPTSVRRTARVLPAFAAIGALALTFGACADAQGPDTTSPNAEAATPSASGLVTLAGNTHPAAHQGNSLGPIEDEFPIEYMQLVLQRPADVEAKLVAAIDALHDPASPTYQHWMTPQDLDAWGPSDKDVAAVTDWLKASGFRVDHVAPGKMWIEFSGNVGQIKKAFHTEMHRLSVNGKAHIANMSDPQIPAELAKTVVGVSALHDFMPHAMHKKHGAVKLDRAKGSWSSVRASATADKAGPTPDDTIAYTDTPVACTAANQAKKCTATLSGAAPTCNTTLKTCIECQSDADCFGPGTCNTATNLCSENFLAVTPQDFATIYNLNPLFAEGVTGQGQTVAVIEDTTITTTGDVQTFRNAFGLTTAVNPAFNGTFTQIKATGSAATCKTAGVNGAEGEAALDADWASASAPGAAIELAACADTATTFGGLVALENLIVATSPPQVVSISYGECEADNGTAANKQFSSVYQMAAAAGISVFVSAGDEGAASCDANQAVATQGIAVSGWASTPYNVAVGGTDFKDYYTQVQGGPAMTTYWGANNASFGSALSYIPEIPWNDSCASQLLYSTPTITKGTYTQGYGATGFCNSTIGANFQTTGAGSGGPSTYSAQPSWQTGVVGLPTKSGGKRYLPDVSLFAANGVFGHFLLYCLTDTAQGGGPCTYSNAADSVALAAGGTSFASPALAGIQALVNQHLGAKTGNPNYVYYKLAAAEHGLNGSKRCNSSGGTTTSPVLPHEECVFNDVTSGDIAVNCTGPNCFGASGTTTDGVLSSSTTALAPAYGATTGWDFATGLGSVNAYNLVHSWSN